jgi:hypothetical protein
VNVQLFHESAAISAAFLALFPPEFTFVLMLKERCCEIRLSPITGRIQSMLMTNGRRIIV